MNPYGVFQNTAVSSEIKRIEIVLYQTNVILENIVSKGKFISKTIMWSWIHENHLHCAMRKEKIWDFYPDTGPTAAKDVYVRNLARKSIEYAQQFYTGSYFILSAKYGFLHPDDIIPENYDVTFNDPTTNPISIPELIETASRKDILNAECVISVVPKNYAKIVRKVFLQSRIIEPLFGCKGNGEMMAELNKAMIDNTPIKTR